LNSSACCGQQCRQLCQLCCQYGRLCRHHILHMTVRCSPIPGTINSDLLMLRLVLSCRLTHLSAIIVSTLSPISATNRQQLEFGSLLRSTLSPTRSTLSPIRSTLSPNVERPFNFVATVHGAKATKWTVLNSTVLPVCNNGHTNERMHARDYSNTVTENCTNIMSHYVSQCRTAVTVRNLNKRSK